MILNPNNWEYITFIKFINKIRCTILAFLILQSKHILHKWVLYNNLSNEIFFCYKWLLIFE